MSETKTGPAILRFARSAWTNIATSYWKTLPYTVCLLGGVFTAVAMVALFTEHGGPG